MGSKKGVKYDDFFAVLKSVIKKIKKDEEYKDKNGEIERSIYVKPIFDDVISKRITALKRRGRKIDPDSLRGNVTRRIYKDLDIFRYSDLVIDFIITKDDTVLRTLLVGSIESDGLRNVFLKKIEDGLNDVEKLLDYILEENK